MKVRPANKQDIPRIVEMGTDFYAQTKHSTYSEYRPDAVGTMIEMLLANGGVFVAELDNGQIVGGTAGLLYPFWMNPDHLTGQEMFWYVEPEHRKSKAGKLMFEALENWAKEKGAHTFCMTALASLHEQRVGQMYESKGYVPMERTYIKAL